LCLLGGGAGCKSSSPVVDTHAAAPFAAVEIRGNTPGQISKMAEAVFREHGYLVIRADLTSLVFEKKGSKLSNFAYGNWMSDSSVWVRVKASIVPVAEAEYRLQCTAYDVQDRGVAIEEESKMSHLRSRPYQQLLEEVARRLKGEG
ncbi:MAG TPA: hypothetical protein VNT26_18920, partial [Candidatus Sulfotelmatobacter sp.]|nr:hypothetical protein [Candidatus Sulfotelmatobacter sp.]